MANIGEEIGGKVGRMAGTAGGAAASGGLAAGVGGAVGEEAGEEVGKAIGEKTKNLLGDSPPFDDFIKLIETYGCDDAKYYIDDIKERLREDVPQRVDWTLGMANDCKLEQMLSDHRSLSFIIGSIQRRIQDIDNSCDLSKDQSDDLWDEIQKKTDEIDKKIANEFKDNCRIKKG